MTNTKNLKEASGSQTNEFGLKKNPPGTDPFGIWETQIQYSEAVTGSNMAQHLKYFYFGDMKACKCYEAKCCNQMILCKDEQVKCGGRAKASFPSILRQASVAVCVLHRGTWTDSSHLKCRPRYPIRRDEKGPGPCSSAWLADLASHNGTCLGGSIKALPGCQDAQEFEYLLEIGQLPELPCPPSWLPFHIPPRRGED